MLTASAPRYLDTKHGRIALISANTTFDPSAIAGEQSPRFAGRPGVNGLRIEKSLQLTKEDLECIKRIAKESNINAEKEISRKEGYSPELPENQAAFGDLKCFVGETNKHIMKINEKDIERVEKAIYEAKLQADYIIVSVHCHHTGGNAKENPPEFLQEFAHRCIDSGANAIVGHGPHLLRPIEVYKDSPIFYSLGDFILQLYDIELAPEDFFAKQGLTSSSTVHDLLKKRSKDFTRGLMTDKRMFMTVIPCWETEGTKLTKLELLPVELAMTGNHSQIGLPRVSGDPEILEYLGAMCVPFGTKIEVGGINETVSVVIPEFTQTNTKITVKNKGTKVLNKNAYGDLIVTVVVELPKSLDRAQKLLIEKLNSDISLNQDPKKKQYNDKIK